MMVVWNTAGWPTPFGEEILSWPEAGMSLFTSGNDWTQVACVGFSEGQAYPRVRGFRVAAELIAQHIASNGRDQDLLVFPYLYCSRQHVELALKNLTRQLRQLNGQPDKARITHRLDLLWQDYLRELRDAGLDSDTATLHVGRIVDELHDIDPKGDAFRYAFGTGGDPHLPTLGNISIDVIEDAMTRLANYFDAVACEVDVLLDAQAEMASACS